MAQQRRCEIFAANVIKMHTPPWAGNVRPDSKANRQFVTFMMSDIYTLCNVLWD